MHISSTLFSRPFTTARKTSAANELGYAYGSGSLSVKLFSDCTGNYAEVTLPGSYECVCGMKLCCIVDTDTMEVRGVCPVEEL